MSTRGTTRGASSSTVPSYVAAHVGLDGALEQAAQPLVMGDLAALTVGDRRRERSDADEYCDAFVGVCCVLLDRADPDADQLDEN